MLLHELPEEFTESERSEAAAVAAAEEVSFDSLDDLGRRLRQQGEALGGAVGALLIVDGLICSYMVAAPGQAQGNGHLAPSIEWTNGAVFPPEPHRFPDSVRGYIERRAQSTKRHDLSARYHEFIWQRWNDHRSGRAARASHLEAGRGADLGNPVTAIGSMDHLARAAELAMMLDDERSTTRRLVSVESRRGLDADSLGHACSLAERSARLLAQDSTDTASLIEAFVAAAERAGRADQFHRDRSYSETAEILARTLGDSAGARAAKARRAASFEAEGMATESGMSAQHWLAEAIRVHAELGSASEVERLKPAMREASERMVGELKPILTSARIPDEAIEEAVDATSLAKGAGFSGLLALPDELGVWPEWELVAQGAEREARAHPLLHLVPSLKVEPDARVQPEPIDETEGRLAHQIRSFNVRTSILMGLCRLVVDSLRRRGMWSADAIAEALESVDGQLAASTRPGLANHEEGDYWSAVHVLMPQIERATRLVGIAAGASVERLSADFGFRWATLDGLLAEPGVRRSLGESFATELEGLLVNPHGQNLRNNVAHGAVAPGSSLSDTSLLAIFILLSIGERLQALKP